MQLPIHNRRLLLTESRESVPGQDEYRRLDAVALIRQDLANERRGILFGLDLASEGAVVTAESPTTTNGGIGWVDILPIALPVSGLLLYGALAMANTYFYEELGTSPDEVGLNYANTIARSLGFIVVIVIATALAIAGAIFFASRRSSNQTAAAAVQDALTLEANTAGRQLGRLESEYIADKVRREHRRDRRRVYTSAALAALLFLFIVVVFVLTAIAGARAKSVKSGDAVNPVRLVGLVILPVQADRAEVVWIRTDGKSPQLPAGLLYLGNSSGTSILYDPMKQSLLRLPSSSIMIVVK